MKAHRLVTLFAAVLITVSLAEVFSHEQVGDSQAQPAIVTASIQ
jgi:hypothetical protein